MELNRRSALRSKPVLDGSLAYAYDTTDKLATDISESLSFCYTYNRSCRPIAERVFGDQSELSETIAYRYDANGDTAFSEIQPHLTDDSPASHQDLAQRNALEAPSIVDCQLNKNSNI